MANEVKYCQSGNMVRLVKMNPETAKDSLAAQIYSLCYDDFMGYYLEIIKDRFEVPEVIFGEAEKRAQQVITTAESRTSSSTGVLLTGNKGSGKTLLTELICNKAIDSGKPVVMINEPFCDQGFYDTIETLGDSVILIDEFAKKYTDHRDGPRQNSLLSLMDGTTGGKRLVLLTENNKNLISEYIISRPGRVFYHWEYSKLNADTIKEFCDFYEMGDEDIEQIIELSGYCYEFSYDMLTAIVEECKRYNKMPNDVIEDLNIERLKVEQVNYKLTKVVDSEKKYRKFDELIINGDRQDFHVYFDETTKSDSPTTVGGICDDHNESTYFSRRHMVSFDQSKMVYDNGNFVAIFKRAIRDGIDYSIL